MAGRKASYSLSTRLFATLLCFLPLLSGCVLGPAALRKTHGRYHDAVKQVLDEGLLRNLVRLRYTESFSTLDVASITAQFEADASAEARPFFAAPNPAGFGIFRTFPRVLPDVLLSGADRPTATGSTSTTATMTAKRRSTRSTTSRGSISPFPARGSNARARC